MAKAGKLKRSLGVQLFLELTLFLPPIQRSLQHIINWTIPGSAEDSQF